MDEAGLPEESLESLKVLHYHLDRKEVSFVAISNHLLDAAKTNRAVSLYRSEPSIDELRTLAKGCLCDNVDDPPVEMKKDLDLIVKFCPVYHEFMKNPEFKRFYGLRDFIHFINFLQRQRSKRGITEKVVMHSLERNFNGSKLFDSIAKEFMNVVS
jgi:hemicentin